MSGTFPRSNERLHLTQGMMFDLVGLFINTCAQLQLHASRTLFSSPANNALRVLQYAPSFFFLALLRISTIQCLASNQHLRVRVPEKLRQ